MTLTASAVRPVDALAELARAIATAKAGDPLSPVTVVVPTNTCGVMARRALGRQVGIVGVDMVTLNRLAELLAGPTLAASGRSPMSSSVVELTIAQVLDAQPGSFRDVAGHPTTIVALRRVHEEIRLAGPGAATRLAASSMRAQEATRVSRAVTARLEAAWYDEADLFAEAARLVDAGDVTYRGHVVVYLPTDLDGLADEFVQVLAERVDVHLVHPDLDTEPDMDLDEDRRTGIGDPADGPGRRVTVVSTTDADDEVRHAVRAVLDAARTGVPFERIALLWPTQQPYARLVEHHLDAAGIAWNGRPGTVVAERLAPRLVLDLLDIDRRGLRRQGLFSLLADVPPRDSSGALYPTAAWERASRQAGVARDDDWGVRLGPLIGSERWGATADSLLAFVTELRTSLGHPARTRRWSEWADWCIEQIERWVGSTRLERLPEAEYRAFEALTAALDRLRHLDPVGEPVTRHRFRAALESELDAMPGRVGRVGDGVTVGALAGAVGLDIDVAIVLGAAEGTLPPRPTSDPLLTDAERADAGLPTSDAHTVRLHRALVALEATSRLMLTVPRGDLRSTAHVEPSRWLDRWSARTHSITVASHAAGLAATVFPVSPTEHRLRSRAAHVNAGGELGAAADVATDRVLTRAIAMTSARRNDEFSVFDGDLSTATVPRVGGVMSPSQLETWTACPHAYFARYLLHVTPIEEPADQISITASDIGTTQHRALDQFHRAVIDGALPQPTRHGWTDEHRAALMSMFDDECARAQRRGRTGRSAYWSDERERMRADLVAWLEHDSVESVRRGSTVLASEHGFGADSADRRPVGLALADGRVIGLRGTVDRIDRAADGTIIVTDHKSGAARKYKDLTADDPTLGATVFQLPAYAAAATTFVADHDAPVRAEYSLMGKGDYQRFGYTVTPAVADLVAHGLQHVVDGIEAGYFPHVPERPGWRLYTACLYCDPDELGTAERWADWLRKRRDPRLSRWFGDPVATASAEPTEPGAGNGG